MIAGLFIDDPCGRRLGAARDHGYTPGMTGLGTHPSMTTAAVDSGWAVLEAELDLWQAAGRTASFWWRDDDAVAATPALSRLLALPESARRGLRDLRGGAGRRLPNARR